VSETYLLVSFALDTKAREPAASLRFDDFSEADSAVELMLTVETATQPLTGDRSPDRGSEGGAGLQQIWQIRPRRSFWLMSATKYAIL